MKFKTFLKEDKLDITYKIRELIKEEEQGVLEYESLRKQLWAVFKIASEKDQKKKNRLLEINKILFKIEEDERGHAILLNSILIQMGELK